MTPPVTVDLHSTLAEAPFDDAIALEPIPADAQPHRWSPALRFGFRLAFCYFTMYCLCDGNANVWEALPVIGGYISYYLSLVFVRPSESLAAHLFHLTGINATRHGGGSGDGHVVWISQGLMLIIALVAALVWTALDRRRPNYQTLSAWLRFLIRLTLGMGMCVYGLSKVFPLQMAPPSLAVLNEPLGQSSPMTLLWTMLALNPAYQVICGSAELLGGLLILFRRTALAGALLTAFVMTNVLLYNLFFDVPVKLYAGNLLLMATFVILPDIKPLFQFFWRHQPAAPSGIWVPPARRLGFRRATIGIEIAFAALAIGGLIIGLYPAWKQQHAALMHPSPLAGAWHIDSAVVTSDKGATTSAPILTGDGAPATVIYREPSGRAMVRDTAGVLWRSGFRDDLTKKTIVLRVALNPAVTYAIAQQDSNHLLLNPTGKQAHTAPALALTRIPLPADYPLLDRRGFHWINEWGLER